MPFVQWFLPMNQSFRQTASIFLQLIGCVIAGMIVLLPVGSYVSFLNLQTQSVNIGKGGDPSLDYVCHGHSGQNSRCAFEDSFRQGFGFAADIAGIALVLALVPLIALPAGLLFIPVLLLSLLFYGFIGGMTALYRTQYPDDRTVRHLHVSLAGGLYLLGAALYVLLVFLVGFFANHFSI